MAYYKKYVSSPDAYGRVDEASIMQDGDIYTIALRPPFTAPDYKTLRGAERWMERNGFHPVEDEAEEPQPEAIAAPIAGIVAEDAADIFGTSVESMESMDIDEALCKYGVGWDSGCFIRIQLANGLTVWAVSHDCSDGWVSFVEADGSTVTDDHSAATARSAIAAAHGDYLAFVAQSGESGIYASSPYYTVTVTGGEEEHEYIFETMEDAWDEMATIKNGCGVRATLGNAVRMERRQRIFAKTGTIVTREWLASRRIQREA